VLSVTARPFTGPEGVRYRASISPLERRGALGVDWRLNAICFEREDGSWVGSTPLYHGVALESLTEADLVELLEQCGRLA
jgi:hypothetical protein